MSDYLKNQIEIIEKKIKDAQGLKASEPAMSELVDEEIKDLEEQKSQLEKALEGNSTQEPEIIGNSVILEIRSAAGGDEAGLFATDLARMYTRYAGNQNWRVEELDKNEGGIGNTKEVIYKISGKNVYDHLKYESGVHRVQRVPVTEAGSLIH